jgi:hypothetical protein
MCCVFYVCLICGQYRKINNETLRQHDDFTFPIVNFIFQHHMRMEFTFHNSYVVLELVSCTMIFWTKLSCLRKNYSNKATLILNWSHRCKMYTSSSRSGWPLRNSHVSAMWGTWRVSCKRQELLTLPEHLNSLPVFGGVRVAHLLVFFVLFLCLVYQGSNQNP